MSALAATDDALSVRSADGCATLHVTVRGDGPPLVLVHGWPLDQRAFEPQIDSLSRSLRVVAWDRRGFGRSTGLPGLDADLADLECILDTLSLETVHLLGMSQGGRIALRFAVTHPQRIRSLLLQAPAVDGFRASCSEEAIPLGHYAALVREGRVADVRTAWLAHPMMSAGVHEEATAAALASILADYRGADLLGSVAAKDGSPVDVAGTLDALDMPVLILTGALETAARREHAAFLRARLPQAREVVFVDSGHLSNVTEPERYNREVLSFCQAVESGRRAED
jgi:pimeloyl-ACP methyl ester carboxylesterase